ncbi:hypothetical protein NQZ68_036124 [Dissostichus eleginoides]|nr:hypothetical protein NQZ68_036124 [Dissostichus eleginoides]
MRKPTALFDRSPAGFNGCVQTPRCDSFTVQLVTQVAGKLQCTYLDVFHFWKPIKTAKLLPTTGSAAEPQISCLVPSWRSGGQSLNMNSSGGMVRQLQALQGADLH